MVWPLYIISMVSGSIIWGGAKASFMIQFFRFILATDPPQNIYVKDGVT